MGVPQGGPLSPVLANVVLDELDWELERRGHRFARYADDCNIVVASERAGERVMAEREALYRRLTATHSEYAKERGGPSVEPHVPRLHGQPQRAETQGGRQGHRQVEGPGARADPSYTWPPFADIVAELREALLGWKAYFGIAEVLSPLRDIDKWIRRKLRCYHWKQWGRAGYRELRRRGVSVREAWNTSKSAHGPWRLSRTPALAKALPARYFAELGLPALAEK